MPATSNYHFEFFRQFRQRFETTGAITPSSRFLARAMTGPLRRRNKPVRVLEVGPGTGAVTQTLVKCLGPDDHLDLVELNESFVEIVKRRFETEPEFQAAAAITEIHVCPLQEFTSERPYDVIISGLPLNNFSPELVSTIFESYFRLLAPGGTLSYFEYMFLRSIKCRLACTADRRRLHALNEVIGPYLQTHRFERSWVFVNFPPAWVQHLRAAPAVSGLTVRR